MKNETRRHWQGLMPKEGRTACGIRLTDKPSVPCFDDKMFGGLVEHKFYGLCFECVELYKEEENRTLPPTPAKRRVRCEGVTKPKTVNRPVGGSQCRDLVIEGSNPPRCWRHKGKWRKE